MEKAEKGEVQSFTIEQFYKFLSEEKLMAAQCRECGAKFLPPRIICTNCYSKNLTWICLLYTSPSPRDLSTSRMPSSA